MKKCCMALLTALLLSLLTACALAEPSQDITAECTFRSPNAQTKLKLLTDRDYGTTHKTVYSKKAYISVVTPADKPCYGVYLCFGGKAPRAWDVQIEQDGKWVAVAGNEGQFLHEYAALPGVTEFRVVPRGTGNASLWLTELFVLGPGDKPDWVQEWQPAPAKVDLMILSAHPDDEILFMGGTLPYYAGELKKNVVVCYMTYGTQNRRSELLDGLWVCGVRTYPDIGTFEDEHCLKLNTAYKYWKKTTVNKYITNLIRRYQPDVLISHDIEGEYGHGAHRLCADAVQTCILYAADATKYKDSLDTYGVWAVKKLYLHLYAKNPIVMDWRQPLDAFGGETAFDVAVRAYAKHVSQHGYKQFVVEPEDSPYSCFKFGLVHTMVGQDVVGGDFFENIP